VRFTPGGKIVVVDAIGALLGEQRPESVWKRLKAKRPSLHGLFEEHDFGGSTRHQVTDSHGWEVIESELFDYLVDSQEPKQKCTEKDKCPT
jgi:hypothetical protein